MKIIAGAVKGDNQYSITFNEKKRSEVKVGYLPQDFSIFPNLTVLETLTVLFILKKEDITRIEDLLLRMNLNTYKHTKMKELSGGVYKRVGIAQALIENPDYLVIDEPTAGLDISECIKLRKLLIEISSRVQIIISSHLPSDIELICDYIVVIEKGEKKFEGSLDEMVQLSQRMIHNEVSTWKSSKVKKNAEQIFDIERIDNNFIRVKYLTQKLSSSEHYTEEKENDGSFLGSYLLLTKGSIE